MALHITINLPESVANDASTVSELRKEVIMQKVEKILMSQGFSCFDCSNFRYKLLELSDCQGTVLTERSDIHKRRLRYSLKLLCGEQKEIAQFELVLTPAN